jgi:hypothetical protein
LHQPRESKPDSEKSGKAALNTAAQEKFNATGKQEKQLQPEENSETCRQTTYLTKTKNKMEKKSGTS